MNSALQVWKIDENSFPFQESAQNQAAFLLQYAILAPSAHNTQPWKCRIEENALNVYFDQKFALPFSDPTSREAYLSLGAFVANYCEAARAYGLDAKIDWLPDGVLDDHPVTRITITDFDQAKLGPDSIKNLSRITERRVDRSLYRQKKVGNEILAGIQECNLEDEFNIECVSDKEQLRKLAKCVSFGMQFAFKNSKFRTELANYIIPNMSRRKVGIPGNTSDLNLIASFVLPKIMRKYDIGASQARKEEKLFLSAPHIIIIGSEADDHLSWLKAGALFERIALYLTEQKVSYALSGAPVEAPMLPVKVQQIISSRFRPQLFFRIGYSDAIPDHSPRKPVSEILTG